MSYQNNAQFAQNQNFYNNGYGVNPQYPFGGGNGVVPNNVQQPHVSNWLSKEKMDLLKKGIERFSLSVSDEDIARGQCNHYNMNGQCTLIPETDGSGRYCCQICGTSFSMEELTEQEVMNATEKILDVLNQIKVMYMSLDSNAACDYFQIIPFIEKIPKLYSIAAKDFKRYEDTNAFIPTQSQNPFNLFGMLTNPGMMAGYYQQPQYGYGMNQPYGYGAAPNMMNMQNAGYAQPNPQYNPMYGQQPMQNQPMNNQNVSFNPGQNVGYQPQTTGFAMNPQGAAAPQPQQSTPVQQPVTDTPGNQYVQQVAPANTTAGNSGDVKVETPFKA